MLKQHHLSGSRPFRFLRIAGCVLLTCAVCSADEPPTPIKHQVTGLFSKERVDDLKEVFKKMPEFELQTIDFERAEISVVYVVEKSFPGANPVQVVERFDNRLRNETRHTFGIKALCTTPHKELELIEIPIVGLDCKACCLGAYEAIYRIEGVEQATASFKDGLVTARIHPEKTNREALEDALRKRGVTLFKSKP